MTDCCPYAKLARRLVLAAAAFAIGVSATTAYAYLRLQAESGGAINSFFWPQSQMPLSYVVSYANLPGDVSQSDFDGAVRRAFQVWQDNPTSSVTFIEDSNPANKLRSDFEANDSHLVVFDPNNSTGFFGQAGIIAVTPIEFFDSGEIIDADILLNDRDFNFSADLSPDTFDIQNIVTHEVGHFIGLDHSGVVGATMIPFSRRGEVRGRSLAQDDRSGAAAIYPVAGTALGTLRGRLRDGGSAVRGAQVVAIDRVSGKVAAATISNNDGTWILRRLPNTGDYAIYAEPLDGPVTAANISPANPGSFDTDFGTTFYGGSQNPTGFSVTAGATIDIGDLSVRDIAAPGPMNITDANRFTITQGQTLSLRLSTDNIVDNVDTIATSSPDLAITIDEVLGSFGTTVRATVTAPDNAEPGLYNIVIRRSTTNDVVVFTAGLEVRPPAPTISAIEPSSADALAGATITITGANFRAGLAVLLDGQAIPQTAVISDTQINLTLPPLVSGTKDVRVENDDGQFALARGAFTATGAGLQPPPPPGAIPTPPPPPVGGGGGGGGCDTAPGAPQSPLALLPCALLLLILGAARRRG